MIVSLRGLSLVCPENRLYRSIPLRVKGRIVNKSILSKEARAKSIRCIYEIRKQLGGNGPGWDTPCTVSVTWWPIGKRFCDVMAYNKQLFDCLAKAGIVTDDKHLVAGHVERMPTKHPDYPKGCIEVTIEALPTGKAKP